MEEQQIQQLPGKSIFALFAEYQGQWEFCCKFHWHSIVVGSQIKEIFIKNLRAVEMDKWLGVLTALVEDSATPTW